MNLNEMKNEFRPVATPLFVADPFLSIWSFSDELYGDHTRHWSGRVNSLFAGVTVDDVFYLAMGGGDVHYEIKRRVHRHLKQISCQVTPLKTIYVLENKMIRLTLTFLTPLLADRLDILSRPVSYMEYYIEILDGKEHDITFSFGISGECCVNEWNREISFGRTDRSLYVGNIHQNPLYMSGDDVCIDWGYLHLADSEAKVVGDLRADIWSSFCKYDLLDENKTYYAFGERPYLYIEKKTLSGVVTVALDEGKAIEYFGEKLDPYYKKFFPTFDAMLAAAVEEYSEIRKLCDAFDDVMMQETGAFGEKYEKLTSLAYRQVMAGHKLVENEKGEILYFSKECFSNGCIGTLDITYPSMPLFLKLNPELLLGMLRPILHYATKDIWPYEFTPHDVGRYPIANGSFYNMESVEGQMPVEECGNMLLCVAAYTKRTGDFSFAKENRPLLKQWADYLVKVGYNPDNQLCTDDFAGHLAQNCNLSLKGILGVASYGYLFHDGAYTNEAKVMSEEWKKNALCFYGSKLAFDQEGTWSLKYNMIWDKLLNFHLFEEEIFQKEISFYREKMCDYGVPLDSRAIYTKADWEMWTTVLTDDKDYFDLIVDRIYTMVNTTEDRVPFCDWYDAKTGKQSGFQNRTVLGGLFINLL